MNIIRFLAALLFVVSFSTAYGQKKLIDKFLSNSTDSSRKERFLVLPALGYAQETGLEIGIVSLTSFYTEKTDTLTRSSNISAIATFTTKKQFNLVLRPDIWSPNNRYHYLGEIRYKDFPFNFYGIGNRTLEADEDVIIQKFIRVNAEVEKQIRKGIYTGVSLDYEHYRYSDKEPGGIYETGGSLIRDKDGGQALFLGLSQIIDTRNTNTYSTRGVYVKASYSYAPDFFGGENFAGSLLKLDFRSFKSYSPKSVLGINFVYQSLQGNKTPFYLYAQLGNDQVMRGYYTGRYRQQNLMAAQAEFRYRFMPRFGLAGFAGAGNVYTNGSFSLEDFKPSYGAGFRYFVEPSRGLTIRLDYAYGEKRRGEERQKGFYLSLAEAF